MLAKCLYLVQKEYSSFFKRIKPTRFRAGKSSFSIFGNMIVVITLVRYPKALIPLALLAMALHRIPLILTQKCSFWKLLGCGKNGTFSLNPDWQQWGLLSVWDNLQDWEDFDTTSTVSKWWKFFGLEKFTLLCRPIAGHGKWDGKEPFLYDKTLESTGPVLVLTRAAIKLNRLKSFWKNVDPVSEILKKAPGYITSFGVGETPVYKQATISVWRSFEDMKTFSYQTKEHAEVIKKTREEHWYSEELFARFIIIKTEGSLTGINPVTQEKVK